MFLHHLCPFALWPAFPTPLVGRDPHDYYGHSVAITFAAGQPLLDANDLVQVKYEMLRSVRQNGRSATDAAASFGFSRPSFYQARALFEEGGLPSLLPQRPGPKRAHKLSEQVVDLLEAALREDSSLSPGELVQMLDQQLGLKVHPRSVQRALERRRKKVPRAGREGPGFRQ